MSFDKNRIIFLSVIASNVVINLFRILCSILRMIFLSRKHSKI